MSTNSSMIVISDIHGFFNHLESIISQISTQDLLICLGDIDEYGKFTSNALKFLEALNSKVKILCISGNCDHPPRDFLVANPHWSLEKRSEQFNDYLLSGFGGTIRISEFIKRARGYLHGKKVTPKLQENIEKEFDDCLYLEIKNGYYKALPENSKMRKRWSEEETIHYFEENEIYDFFSTIESQRRNQIWFTHCPPYEFPESKDIVGVSSGSKGLLKAIKEKQPKLVISGHLHKEGIWNIGESTCISIPPLEEGRFAIVDIVDQNITYSFLEL